MIKIDPDVLEVTISYNTPGGQHCGMPDSWITVLHKPTMQSVTVHCEGREWHDTQTALDLLELIITRHATAMNPVIDHRKKDVNK